ncbi:spermatogenesis [Trichomonas vaginalis G3]|nr:spermatogenesis [Trichomonas vaginalis G3]KAI5503449.1 spermatogenesis [Trichomonas vaginalis G3]
MACMSGYLEIIQILVEQGADVHCHDNHGWTPLHRAVLWDYVPIVQFLLAKGADPNAIDLDGFTPLHMAAKWDHFESAEYLIKAGANPNAQTNRFEPSFITRTPFELAFLNRRTKVARVLRKAGGEAQQEFIKKLSPEEKKVFNSFGV